MLIDMAWSRGVCKVEGQTEGAENKITRAESIIERAESK